MDGWVDVYLYVWFVGEGVVVSDGSQEHLYADDEVLYQLNNSGSFYFKVKRSEIISSLTPSPHENSTTSPAVKSQTKPAGGDVKKNYWYTTCS